MGERLVARCANVTANKIYTAMHVFGSSNTSVSLCVKGQCLFLFSTRGAIMGNSDGMNMGETDESDTNSSQSSSSHDSETESHSRKARTHTVYWTNCRSS